MVDYILYQVEFDWLFLLLHPSTKVFTSENKHVGSSVCSSPLLAFPNACFILLPEFQCSTMPIRTAMPGMTMSQYLQILKSCPENQLCPFLRSSFLHRRHQARRSFSPFRKKWRSMLRHQERRDQVLSGIAEILFEGCSTCTFVIPLFSTLGRRTKTRGVLSFPP